MSLREELSESERNNKCRDLEILLRKKYGNELVLKNYSVDRLVPVGENFCSNLLKINAKVQRTKDSPIEDLHFVAKTVLDSQLSGDCTNMYTKEIFMYTNIIPFYKRIEIEYGTDENKTIENIVPVLCGHRLSLDPDRKKIDKDAMILLENLKVQGYFVVDKKIGLDMQCATKVIRALARFHALGIVAQRQYPVEFEAIKTRTNPPKYDMKILDTIYTKFMETIKRESCFRSYVSRVEDMITRYKGATMDEPLRDDPWSTIAHSDFWTNNILFRDENVKFIDFQTYMHAEVFTDLVYFLCTSLSDEMKVNHFDEMIVLYYENLVEALRRMRVISGDGDGDDGEYSRKEFNERLKKGAGKQFFHCAFAMFFFTAEVAEGDEDQEGLTASLMTCRGNDLYFQKLLQILKIYEEKGWLHLSEKVGDRQT